MTKLILLAFGTRPEAIKMGPVYEALTQIEGLRPRVLLTGQHKEQLAHGLSLYAMDVIANLDVMSELQSLPSTAVKILGPTSRVLREVGPDYVVVQGDTLTTFCVAWTAFLLQIPVAHVEAGLRTYDLLEPFPEEGSRRLTDALSSLHLAPTPTAGKNLVGEGLDPDSIIVTGQTGVDAVLHATEVGTLPSFLPPPPFVTITLHRRENWSKLGAIAGGLARVAKRFDDRVFVFPVHLNPLVGDAVSQQLGEIPNVKLIRPLDYASMAAVLSHSELVITDSGGIQEEAVTLRVPIIVVRGVSERMEGEETGLLRVVGTDPEDLVREVTEFLASNQSTRTDGIRNPFGDGRAGQRCAHAIAWKLGLHDRPKDWQPEEGG